MGGAAAGQLRLFFALSGALVAFVALSTVVVYACARMIDANLEKNRQPAKASSGKREMREACKRRTGASLPGRSSSISVFWPF